MRAIHTHESGVIPEPLIVEAAHHPAKSDGSHALYRIRSEAPGATAFGIISFQSGPISEMGVNGITHESLLAIIIDRLECFQAGPYACQENADALAAIRVAMAHLHNRTAKRVARGVEGTREV